ncbi:hypothetical protein SEMRO_2_G001151.1 [Seminavis robusta]|uniref:Uncharacterized protein n=1 Tax=Seminavis robusta TaxID=568900 RepID=A0A9N8D8G3_9STRA|nr:hypothetical protein SEMRO_2_G001151.1 [Seminavis robusta]|eukprot:Sro2_g001151.1  (211) ;mRNA; r:37979-38611
MESITEVNVSDCFVEGDDDDAPLQLTEMCEVNEFAVTDLSTGNSKATGNRNGSAAKARAKMVLAFHPYYFCHFSTTGPRRYRGWGLTETESQLIERGQRFSRSALGFQKAINLFISNVNCPCGQGLAVCGFVVSRQKYLPLGMLKRCMTSNEYGVGNLPRKDLDLDCCGMHCRRRRYGKFLVNHPGARPFPKSRLNKAFGALYHAPGGWD